MLPLCLPRPRLPLRPRLLVLCHRRHILLLFSPVRCHLRHSLLLFSSVRCHRRHILLLFPLALCRPRTCHRILLALQNRHSHDLHQRSATTGPRRLQTARAARVHRVPRRRRPARRARTSSPRRSLPRPSASRPTSSSRGSTSKRLTSRCCSRKVAQGAHPLRCCASSISAPFSGPGETR